MFLFRKAFIPALGVFIAAPAVVAANDVFLGQTGVTNTISVDQIGIGNFVGGDRNARLVSQLGLSNALDVDQTGTSNLLGSALSSGPLGLVGVLQSGDNNRIVVRQDNALSGGSNSIGAILQTAPSGVPASNLLTVIQRDRFSPADVPGSGGSGHSVGEVSQSADGGGLPNSAELTQLGSQNRIGTLIQRGSGQQAAVRQQEGSGNVAQILDQSGEDNEIDVVMAGDRNLLVQVLQQSIDVGNLLTLSLAGTDNGSNAMGGVGHFSGADTKLVPAAQAAVSQFGDQNSISYTTSWASHANLYGFFQSGDGNSVAGSVDGEYNEAAVAQRGEGNTTDFVQDGDKNEFAADILGDENRIIAGQTGDSNQIAVMVDASNRNNAPWIGGFSFAAGAAYEPGSLVQQGDLNAIRVSVLGGGSNKFSIHQNGNQNSATGIVSGTGNQALVVQTGALNDAHFSQIGSGNQVLILQ